MALKILFAGHANEDLQEYLRQNLPGHEFIFVEDASDERLVELAADTDITIGWSPTKEMLLAAKKLKLHINPGAGVQHITPLFVELEEGGRNIPLVNGHGNAFFTAQSGVALLLALMGKTIQHHNWMTKGNWRFGDEEAKNVPLRKRKVGFLGYGHVNQKVHELLVPFDLEFHALKKSWPDFSEPLEGLADTLKGLYVPKEMEFFLKAIDILIIAAPKTDETRGLIGEKELALLGKDAFLVNIARGSIVDEEALYKALKNGIIAGAAIDVWYDYHPEPDEDRRKYPYAYPFHELDNIVLSPHRAASPYDDLERWGEVVDNINRVAEGRTDFLNMVDIHEGY